MSLVSLFVPVWARPVWARPVAIALAVATVVGTALWYRASLIEKGRDEISAEWKTANDTAVAVQATKNTTATAQLATKTADQKTIYKTRIEEILVYVPTTNTACPSDADFERLYNSSGATGDTSP